MPNPMRVPANPPVPAPTATPASAETIGPAASSGPIPGMANAPAPARRPAVPPITPPVAAPVANPSLFFSLRTRFSLDHFLFPSDLWQQQKFHHVYTLVSKFFNNFYRIFTVFIYSYHLFTH